MHLEGDLMQISIGHVCNFVLLATPNNLLEQEIIDMNESRPFTHYLVCETNRLRIKPESIKHRESEIAFTVFMQINDFDWEAYDITMPRVRDGITLFLKVEGNYVQLNKSNGDSHQFANTFLFLERVAKFTDNSEMLSSILKLDVQYIGKTEISKKYLRFKGHEKISKVANEIIDNKPHKEIIVKLLSFQKPFTQMLVAPELPFDDSRDDWMPGGGLIENMPRQHWISGVEGALIKYFQPLYNVHYKDNYPSERHSSYGYFYDNNVRSIFVELHEEYMSYTTGNSHVPYTKIRLIQYALRADDSGVYIHDNSQGFGLFV